MTVDGIDVRELAQRDLRRRVGTVLQDVALFSGTVADNIALGRGDIDAETIERSARAVRAHGFISALAKGYDFFTYYFTLFMTPMMFLSGVFFPLEQLPTAVQAVAAWLPLTNAVALVRPLFMDQWPTGWWVHAVVLAVYAVVAFWAALALTRKRFRA